MVDERSNYQHHLIHDWRNFSADSIRNKVEKYDFTQTPERILWEIVSSENIEKIKDLVI